MKSYESVLYQAEAKVATPFEICVLSHTKMHSIYEEKSVLHEKENSLCSWSCFGSDTEIGWEYDSLECQCFFTLFCWRCNDTKIIILDNNWRFR